MTMGRHMPDSELRKEYAARLRQARKAANFNSVQEAAEANGWSVHSYQSYEQGRRFGTIETVLEQAERFNVSPEWLMFGVGVGPGDEEGDDAQQLLAKLSPARRMEALTFLRFLTAQDRSEKRAEHDLNA